MSGKPTVRVTKRPHSFARCFLLQPGIAPPCLSERELGFASLARGIGLHFIWRTAIEQRTPEWFEERRGKVTASRIWDILKTIRSGAPAASRGNYAAQLVSERLTGKVHERFYSNEHMEWGQEQEPAAREAYTKLTGNEIVECGMIAHPTIANAGASPDGLVGEDGLVEVKCLLPKNHIALLLTEEIPEQYQYQMLWQLACTRRKWCDFISYDPTLPDHMQLFIKRFDFNDKEIKHLENEVEIFLNEVEATTESLRKKFPNE